MGVYYRKEHQIGFIEFDLLDSKVNLLNFEVMSKLDKILDEIGEETDVQAVVIVSKKPDIFIAGADIKEIENIQKPSEGRQKSQQGQHVLNKLEDLPMPTVAVIDGVALGGGCELVLACRYRIATFNEKVRIGLPEVNLGILPGFGGCYRLPRLIGLTEGLKMILSARPIDAQKALKVGLVDRLYPQKGLASFTQKFLEEILPLNGSRRPFERKKKGIPHLLENSFLGKKIIFNQSRQSVRKTTKGFYPAPEKALGVIIEIYGQTRESALIREAGAFGELVETQVCKNLIQVFYLSEKYKKLMPQGLEKIKPHPIRKCGVLGAGVMGGGIAQILAYNDIWVRMKDVNNNALALGYQSAAKIFQQTVERRSLTKAQAIRKMDHITGTLDYSGLRNADLVIEAVVENMEVKKKVFKELSSMVSAQTILATNTSALSVTEMARQTRDPGKVVGIHFFNPVHRMPLVEIIKTEFTSSETLAATLSLVKKLGKIPIVVKDSSGFLVNRVLLAYLNEAGRILEEGGSIAAIDEIMTRFGMPMGPFTLSDEVGSDVGLKVLHILHDHLGGHFKPVSIFEKIFEKGLLGKKSGKGFYIHGIERLPNQEILHLLLSSQPMVFKVPEEDCLNRMLLLMINEAARCLEEGVVEETSAVDVGMIMGTGFPAFRGGLLRYADRAGIETIVSTLNQLKEGYHADRFAPCPYLLNLQKQGKTFYP